MRRYWMDPYDAVRCYCYSDQNFWLNQNVPITVTSDFEPYCGQKNRSSENFQVPEDGKYRISAPPGITFKIWHDIQFLKDTDYGEFRNGDTVSLKKKSGLLSYNYYIANPQGAKGYFDVTFTLDKK